MAWSSLSSASHGFACGGLGLWKLRAPTMRASVVSSQSRTYKTSELHTSRAACVISNAIVSHIFSPIASFLQKELSTPSKSSSPRSNSLRYRIRLEGRAAPNVPREPEPVTVPVSRRCNIRLRAREGTSLLLPVAGYRLDAADQIEAGPPAQREYRPIRIIDCWIAQRVVS